MLSHQTVERGPCPNGWRGRVYVIEDDPAARTRVKTLLEDQGYAVTAVPTVEAAITLGFWNGDPARVLVLRRDP
jgi:DNA-binding response OmpR family regulator